jgi:hypothetical protein
MANNNPFWNPIKKNSVQSKQPSLFGFGLNKKTIHKTIKPSFFTPKFIQPVNLKLYPVRTTKEKKLIDRNPWGDKDKDKVPNYFDCRPTNRIFQGKVSPKKDKTKTKTKIKTKPLVLTPSIKLREVEQKLYEHVDSGLSEIEREHKSGLGLKKYNEKLIAKDILGDTALDMQRQHNLTDRQTKTIKSNVYGRIFPSTLSIKKEREKNKKWSQIQVDKKLTELAKIEASIKPSPINIGKKVTQTEIQGLRKGAGKGKVVGTKDNKYKVQYSDKSVGYEEPEILEINDDDDDYDYREGEIQEDIRRGEYGLSSTEDEHMFDEGHSNIVRENKKRGVALIRHHDSSSPASESADTYEIKKKGKEKPLWDSGTTYTAEYLHEGASLDDISSGDREDAIKEYNKISLGENLKTEAQASMDKEPKIAERMETTAQDIIDES